MFFPIFSDKLYDEIIQVFLALKLHGRFQRFKYLMLHEYVSQAGTGYIFDVRIPYERLQNAQTHFVPDYQIIIVTVTITTAVTSIKIKAITIIIWRHLTYPLYTHLEDVSPVSYTHLTLPTKA